MSSDGDLRKLFRSHLPDFDWLSVETGSTSGGVADANFCHDGKEGWIEYKKIDRGWRIHNIVAEQIGWTERRLRNGGRVFIAVRQGGKNLWLYHGSAMRQLLSSRLDEVRCLGSWTGGATKWDWLAIRRILTE